MSKAIKLLISIIVTLFCNMPSVDAQQAFYVYRSDGVINTFISSEIDSMTYSCIDLDSIQQNEYVTQEIYTPDSIYRIPISIIDSVGFVTPKTVYMPGVKVLEGEMRKNIISRNGLTLYFSPATPSVYLPKIGDKLVSIESDDVLESAFIGIVSKVSNTNQQIEVTCNPIDLTEVFECYYGIINKKEELATNSSRSLKAGFYGTNGTCRYSPGKLTKDILNNHNINISYESLVSSVNENRASISLTPTIDYNAYIIVNKTHGINISVTAIGNYTMEELLSLSGKVTLGDCDENENGIGELQLFHKAIPIPEALIDVFFDFGIFNKISATLSIDQLWTQKYKHIFHWEWNSKTRKSQNCINEFKTLSNTHNGKVAINGSWAIGTYGKLGISFIATSSLDIADIAVKGEGGISIEGTYVPYKKDTEYAKKSTDLYNQIKDKKIGVYWFYGLSVEANLFSWSASWDIPNFNGFPLNKKEPIIEVRSVPIFTNTSLEKKASTKCLASTTALGEAHSTNIGFALFNEVSPKDNEYVYIADYDGTKKQISHEFSNLKLNGKYKLYPLVKYIDMELIAEPYAEIESKSTIETGNVKDITYNSALLEGYFSDATNEKYGFCYSKTASPTIENTCIYVEENEDGYFASNITDLEENTTYSVRAFTISDSQITYGDVQKFTTLSHKEMTFRVQISSSFSAFVDVDTIVVVTPKENGWFAETLQTYWYSGPNSFKLNQLQIHFSPDATNPYERYGLKNLSPLYATYHYESMYSATEIIFNCSNEAYENTNWQKPILYLWYNSRTGYWNTDSNIPDVKIKITRI